MRVEINKKKQVTSFEYEHFSNFSLLVVNCSDNEIDIEDKLSFYI